MHDTQQNMLTIKSSHPFQWVQLMLRSNATRIFLTHKWPITSTDNMDSMLDSTMFSETCHLRDVWVWRAVNKYWVSDLTWATPDQDKIVSCKIQQY